MSSSPRRIYLDNAATSWPKPEAVYRAVNRYQRELGSPAGRGVYREAVEVERQIADVRRRLADLIGVAEHRRIVFTLNGTDSLNLALHGLLRAGDHVVTSVIEHNSVLRPLRFLETHGGITVDRVGCGNGGIIDPEDIRRAITPKTRLIVLTHASNVTGAIQPVEEVGRIAKERGVLLLVDAAQSVGQLPVDAKALNADLIAAPGHKGLMGPLGTGFLYIGPDVESQLSSIRQGGTGTHSEEDAQPESLPDKFEAGNLNVPGIVGLGEGIREVQSATIAAIRLHHQSLTAKLLAGLEAIPGIRIVGPKDATRQVGVVSVQAKGYDPQEFAALLDSAYGVQVRAGFHCAAQLHRALGTAEAGGTVRLSVGYFTTTQDIDDTLQAVTEILTE